MSLSLAIAINAVADILLLGGLAWTMSRAAKLTPHVSAADQQLAVVHRLRPEQTKECHERAA